MTVLGGNFPQSKAMRPGIVFLCGMALQLLAITAVPNSPAAVTPNDVYATFELADRILDRALAARGEPPFKRNLFPEKGLKPMHVYQVAVSCVEAIHHYQSREKMIPVPMVIVTPRKYSPGDVLKLADMVLFEVGRIAEAMGVPDLPEERIAFSGKTPTDVYFRIVSVYMKVNMLSGQCSMGASIKISSVSPRLSLSPVFTTWKFQS